MNVVIASLTEEERDALVKMLEHEHFAYGEQGVLAASAFKKIEAAVSIADIKVTLTSEAQPNEIAAAELRDLLCEVEWRSCIWDGVRNEAIDNVCPSCRQVEERRFGLLWPDQKKRFGPAGHATTCKLRALMV